jgi:type II secretory pathway component PulF
MNQIQTWLFMTNQSEPLRQTGLLLVLAGGIGHGDVLLQTLRSHEMENRGTWAAKVGQLRTLLEQGYQLSDALATVSELLPDPTISAIRVGERTGTLSNVLIDEAQRISQSDQSDDVAGISTTGFLIMVPVMFVILVTVVTFLMISIVPKYAAIFSEFGSELPGQTRALIHITDWLLKYWYALFLPMAGLLGLLVHQSIGSIRLRLKHGYHRMAVYWPRYWVPGLLRQLSLAAISGHPLSEALDCVLIDLPPGPAATKISGVRHQAHAGEDVITALRSGGLLTQREAVFLQCSQQNRHLDWALRHLAEAIEVRRLQRVRRLLSLLGPALLIGLGMLVLFVCTAMFLPVVKLVNDLS